MRKLRAVSVRSDHQSGVVMLVALVVLVVMTLAGIGLMRSMDTSTLVAGNMAFKQAATNSADIGVEQAIAWLEGNASYLTTDHPEVGYKASTSNNADLKTYKGEDFWNYYKASGVCYYPMSGGVCSNGSTLDAGGNQISFMIQRLCSGTGALNTTSGLTCALDQGATTTTGSSEGADDPAVSSTSYGLYYRITVKVLGPRNSVSYVQAVVSL